MTTEEKILLANEIYRTHSRENYKGCCYDYTEKTFRLLNHSIQFSLIDGKVYSVHLGNPDCIDKMSYDILIFWDGLIDYTIPIKRIPEVFENHLRLKKTEYVNWLGRNKTKIEGITLADNVSYSDLMDCFQIVLNKYKATLLEKSIYDEEKKLKRLEGKKEDDARTIKLMTEYLPEHLK
jgi:hypothetical protein